MKTITKLMIICLLVLCAVPIVNIVVPFTSNNVFAEYDCPSCYAYRCDVGNQQKACIIACFEETGIYHFYCEIYKWDGELIRTDFSQYVLMVVGGTNCEEPCIEYTAVMNLPEDFDGFTGRWYVWDYTHHNSPCGGDEFLP